MVSKKVALREAKKIRKKGKFARVVKVRVSPNTSTYMIESRTKKKKR